MKAEELMVGDWVCAYNIYPNTKPLEKINLKIKTPLNSYGFIVATYGNRMAEYEDDDIEPIPITPEILEKNGFKTKCSRYFLTDNYFSYWVNVEIEKDGQWWFEDSKNFICRKHIKYVHELQHILRLCNINKEIEL